MQSLRNPDGTIRDLDFYIQRGRGHYTRAAYGLYVYRHDWEGKPYLYDFRTFYGDDGRKVRADAIRWGRQLQREGFRTYRDPNVTSNFPDFNPQRCK